MNILIIPLVLLVRYFRNWFRGIFAKPPLYLAYPLATGFFGLCVEFFSILDNLGKPLSQRALMSPYPLTDLAFGIFYYGLVGIAWYVLLKRYAFTKTDVFLLTGIFLGIVTEQGGRILLGAITSVAGFLLALLVLGVYGVFPTLAYYVTEGRFALLPRTKPLWAYILAVAVLYLEWALFGLFVLPALKSWI